MKVAVVDIGTLKVKLLIVEVTSSSTFTRLYQSNTLTCLGVRMHENNGRPKPEYLRQTIEELKRVKSVLEKEQISKIQVVSTHALREMGNVGYEIASTINDETGFTIEIIRQQEEARLFFQAVVKDFTSKRDFTIVDVGGGTVQILIGNKDRLKHTYLLKTGAQYLEDNFVTGHTENDFPTREEIRKMQQYIMEQLVLIPSKIRTPVVYGSSCIIDVFKALRIKLDTHSDSQNHPYKTNVSELKNVLSSLDQVPYKKRDELYPFKQKYYMWAVDKALLNIVSISKKVDAPYIIPSNANINEGLVLSLIAL